MRAAWWWIDRWRQSTAYTDMTAEEQGLYRNLCDEVWLRDTNVIPDDPRILAKVSGDPDAWSRCGAKVLKWMKRIEGGWTNETAMEVIEQSRRRAARQKRWRDEQRNAPRPQRRNAPRPKPPSQAPSPSWTSEACDDWQEVTGGVAPGGQIGKALKPLVARVAKAKEIEFSAAWAMIRPWWKKYLTQTPGGVRSASHFARDPRQVLDGKGRSTLGSVMEALDEWGKEE